jgi:ATP-dependent protease ClpP protease subunit
MNPHEFYSFRCEAGDEPSSAELMIFSQIGDWEEMGDVSARAFARSLGELPTSVKRLDIHINSPGGSVFEAQGIYSRLADHRSTKHVYVDGLAASAASIIAMVGHKIYIRANANMMIHLPSGIVMGNADDMRQMVTALDSITESMINVYAKRTGLERDEIRSMLGAETWFSPQDAVDKGFADEVRGVVKAAAVVGNNRIVINGVEHDLSRFHNVPAFTATTQTQPMRTLQPKAATTTEDPPDPPNPNPIPPAPPPPSAAPATPPPAAPPPTAAAPTDYEKGVTAERERIAALQKLDKPATHAIVTKAIAEGKTVNDIAAECVEAMSKGVQNAARHTDAAALDGIPASEAGNGNDGAEFGSKLKAAVAKRVAARNRNVRVNSRN